MNYNYNKLCNSRFILLIRQKMTRSFFEFAYKKGINSHLLQSAWLAKWQALGLKSTLSLISVHSPEMNAVLPEPGGPYIAKDL